MLVSSCKQLRDVSLPWSNRQKYMHSFDLSAPRMAPGFEDYLEPVVTLCKAANATAGMAHMTVDEKIVPAGMSQRRPKPHVDGCFMPTTMSWGHQPWVHSVEIPRMAVIVASSVPGCRVWRGLFSGAPMADGDLSHIADQLDDGEVLPANIGYWLSPDCIHESMIFAKPTKRTFLRIAYQT